MVRHKKKYSRRCTLVEESRWDDFERRCLRQLNIRRSKPLRDDAADYDIFGNKYYTSSNCNQQSSYISKLRGFVSFLLDHTDYDDSLLVFYPRARGGVFSVSDEALCYYVLRQFTEKGQPVKEDLTKGAILKVRVKGAGDPVPLLEFTKFGSPTPINEIYPRSTLSRTRTAPKRLT